MNFGFHFNLDHVTFSPSTGSTTTTAGERDYSLNCSVTLFDPIRLPSGVPSPNFQWSFNGSASLPSGVTAMPTVMSSSNSTSETYTSTLQFSSPLSPFLHTGMYICGLGPGRLVNSVTVTVNGMHSLWLSMLIWNVVNFTYFRFLPAPTVQITTSGTPAVGQSGYSLTCSVPGAENLSPSITYQWTKNNGAQTQIGADRVLSFSSLRLSDAGWYTCQATVSSPYLNNDITDAASQNVTIQS